MPRISTYPISSVSIRWVFFLVMLAARSKSKETSQEQQILQAQFYLSCDSLSIASDSVSFLEFKERFGYPFHYGKTSYLSLWLLGQDIWNGNTKVLFVGACPEFTWKPQPDLFLIVQKGDGKFSKPVRIDEARPETFLFVNPVPSGIETLYQDRLWLRFIRVRWAWSEAVGQVESTTDTLSESQFREQYPGAVIMELAENDRLEQIEKKTLFDAWCDLDLDGNDEHILVNDSTGRHKEENGLEYFCTLSVFRVNKATNTQVLWIQNDKLIPCSDESEQITGTSIVNRAFLAFHELSCSKKEESMSKEPIILAMKNHSVKCSSGE